MAYTLDKVHHVGIPTKDEDIDKVKDFYERFLGFKATVDTRFKESGHRMLFMEKGDMIIEFYTLEGPSRVGNLGVVDHLCYIGTNIEELGKAIAAEGYKVEEYLLQRHPDGRPMYGFQFFYGPAGEYVELYEDHTLLWDKEDK